MNCNLAARCGIYCGECEFRQSTGCKGCIEQKSIMFWGTCPVAQCNEGKNLEHCGECESFPCEMLHDFAYDAEHGDGGKRLEDLKLRIKLGTENWLKEKDRGMA